MPTAAEIIQFRADPNLFMRTNIVEWQGAGPEDQANIDVFMVDSGAGRYRTGSKFLGLGNAKADAPKSRVKWANNPMNPAPAGTATFPAVWSGFKGLQGRQANLPAAGGPSIMFTPQLTGCTVVCKTNADGSAQFSHYNYRSVLDATQVDDDANMVQRAQNDYGGGQSTLTKGDYRAVSKHGGNLTVTVVGVRKNGRWEFWAQYLEDKASGLQIRDVRKL